MKARWDNEAILQRAWSRVINGQSEIEHTLFGYCQKSKNILLHFKYKSFLFKILKINLKLIFSHKNYVLNYKVKKSFEKVFSHQFIENSEITVFGILPLSYKDICLNKNESFSKIQSLKNSISNQKLNMRDTRMVFLER